MLNFARTLGQWETPVAQTKHHLLGMGLVGLIHFGLHVF